MISAIQHTRMDRINAAMLAAAARERALSAAIPTVASLLGEEDRDVIAAATILEGTQAKSPETVPNDREALAQSFANEGPLRYLNLDMGIKLDRPVEIWIDTLQGVSSSSTPLCNRFLFLFEPEIVTKLRDKVVAKSHMFQRVFSHDPATLKAVRNSTKFQHGGTWILPSAIDAHELLLEHSAREENELVTKSGEQVTLVQHLETSGGAPVAASGGAPKSCLEHQDTEGAPGAEIRDEVSMQLFASPAAVFSMRTKRFAASFVCGDKNISKGHRLRRLVFDRRTDISNVGADVFVSGARRVGNDCWWGDCPVLPSPPVAKLLLFDCQFHVAIENTSQYDYFSEKIIDCFLTRTIPIYWGCPNISGYFDSSGIISISDEEDGSIVASKIVEALNLLTPADYERRKVAVARNFYLAKQWIDQKSRMECAIKVEIESKYGRADGHDGSASSI